MAMIELVWKPSPYLNWREKRDAYVDTPAGQYYIKHMRQKSGPYWVVRLDHKRIGAFIMIRDAKAFVEQHLTEWSLRNGQK